MSFAICISRSFGALFGCALLPKSMRTWRSSPSGYTNVRRKQSPKPTWYVRRINEVGEDPFVFGGMATTPRFGPGELRDQVLDEGACERSVRAAYLLL